MLGGVDKLDQEQKIKGVEANILISIIFNVDIFFFIADFFLTFTTLPELQKKKSDFNWTLFYIKRLIRYAPSYVFTLVFGLVIMRYIGSGLRWILHEGPFEVCQEFWMGNLIFIQNLISADNYPLLDGHGQSRQICIFTYFVQWFYTAITEIKLWDTWLA